MRGLTPRRQRGMALLMVLIFIALLGSVIADFQFSSQVDVTLAVNARDELQAEYNALSAMRLRAILLRHVRRIESVLNDPAVTQVLGEGGLPPIAQLMEQIPIECGLLSAVLRTSQTDLGDDDEAQEFFPGECMATSQSEHSKISLNMLRRPTGGANTKVQTLLLGLLSDPSLERHFQEDDRTGTHAESPAELIGAITDWIDDNGTQAVNAVGDEDRLYTLRDDNYRTKNAPFDSVAELQLVHGVDDELYALLRDRVTVHAANTQIELATADEMTILLGLAASLYDGMTLEALRIPAMEQFLTDLEQLRMLGAGAAGMLNVTSLRGLLQQYGLDSVIDTNKLSQVFTDKQGSTWYTIEAEGRVGNASRKIRTVFQAREGRFYHIRIE